MSTPNKNLQQSKKETKTSQTKKRPFLKLPSNINFHTGQALKPLIVILGPTASGKSDLALKLALRLDSTTLTTSRSGQAQKLRIKGAEIVSADSRQIYKEMLIATASPLAENQNAKIKMQNDSVKFKNKTIKIAIINKIPHHLLHFIKPKEKFSVAEFKELAVKIIRDIQSRGKIPILAGGTGLYISSVADNIEIPKVKPNLKLRKKLEKTSSAALLKQLKKLDPATFKNIDHKNIRRIIRALEVTISTGIPFSSQSAKGAPLFDVLEIGIDVPREKLYKKIDSRVEKMIKTGLIQETKKLTRKYSSKLPSMSGIGYKEIGMFLRKEITLERAKELIKFATHAYARRQMTWLRRDKRIKWIKIDNKTGFNKIAKTCKSFLLSKSLK